MSKQAWTTRPPSSRIRTSDLVLLIFSTHANTSPYVLREIDRAVAYTRPLLALRVDDAVPNSSIEYYVHAWRTLEARTGVDEKRSEIVIAVREAIAASSSAGRLAPKGRKPAMPWLRPRPRWWLALASVLVVVAGIGLGLGLGLPRDRVDVVLSDGRYALDRAQSPRVTAQCSLLPGHGPGSDEWKADHVRRLRRRVCGEPYVYE